MSQDDVTVLNDWTHMSDLITTWFIRFLQFLGAEVLSLNRLRGASIQPHFLFQCCGG